MGSGHTDRPEKRVAALTGDYIRRLKDRSGRTYDGIAHRTGLSRSTVHRYCRGEAIPRTFAPLEAIATACGADRGELLELHRLWSSEPVPETDPAPSAARPADVPPSVVPPLVVPRPDVPPAEATAPPRRRRLSWQGPKVRAVAVAVVIVLVAWVVHLAGSGNEPGGSAVADTPAEGAQRVLGPAWTDSERAVSPDFFGVTMNSDTGAMPGFRVGAVRFWDGGTRWSEIEPARGRYDWRTLDRLVAGAEGAGLPALFTFGGTPAWASPRGPRTSYEDGSRASAPDDLADWDRFVRAVGARYRGRIQAYELWVLAPSPLYYAGSASTLVAMTRRAAQILRQADPAATIVCPSMGELWKPESRRFLQDFAALGGYELCDVAGVKLHPRDFGQPPETIIELTGLIDRAFHDAGIQPRIWSTGTTYRIATAQRLDERTASNYAVRLFLVTLYARYDRMYFYNWGGTRIPITLQAEGGPPTTAARYVERLQQWLSVARVYSCGTGPDDGLPPQVWRCRFRVGETSAEADVMWSSTGTATVPAPAAGVQRFLDGREIPLSPGQLRHVGEDPSMAIYQPTD
jgi:hypothetical protein